MGALSFRDWKGTMAEQIQCAVLRSVRSVRTMEVPKFTLKRNHEGKLHEYILIPLLPKESKSRPEEGDEARRIKI